MKKFDWADFGSDHTKSLYRKLYSSREAMRSVDIRDFQRAFIDGEERLDFNKISGEYAESFWNDREMLIGKFIREPYFKGGPGTETDTAFVEIDMSWKELNSNTNWRRFNILCVNKRPACNKFEIYNSWIGVFNNGMGDVGSYPGFNRDSAIELTREEFTAEFEKAKKIFDQELNRCF